MAKIIRNNLNIMLGSLEFQVPLSGPIIAIMGDSGTGKSLFYDTVGILSSAGQLTNITLVSQTTVSHDDFITLMSQNKNKVFLVDNADLMLETEEDVDLMYASENQFILLGRRTEFFRLPYENRGFFLVNDDRTKHKLIYLTED